MLKPRKENQCGISEATVNTIHRPWRCGVLQLKTPQLQNLLEEDWMKLKLLCCRHTPTSKQRGTRVKHTHSYTHKHINMHTHTLK